MIRSSKLSWAIQQDPVTDKQTQKGELCIVREKQWNRERAAYFALPAVHRAVALTSLLSQGKNNPL